MWRAWRREGVAEPAGHPGGGVVEDVVVRQYRYLLRTAPLDALERVHAEAIPTLSREARATLLRTLQDGLVVGMHLGPDDSAAMARLVTLGERRAAGILLRGLPPEPLRALAGAAVGAEAAFGLFAGYAAWDGLDPEVEDERPDNAGFSGTGWHAARLNPGATWQGALDGGAAGPGGALDGGVNL